MISPQMERTIEIEVAYHLGILARGFRCNELHEENRSNAHETHFIINMDNGRKFGFEGDVRVKYTDVVPGDEGIEMAVRFSGGHDYRVEPPLMIFCNRDRKYPIRCVPDKIVGFAYRTGPKGWMGSSFLV